jgi:hypothetical protein
MPTVQPAITCESAGRRLWPVLLDVELQGGSELDEDAIVRAEGIHDRA